MILRAPCGFTQTEKVKKCYIETKQKATVAKLGLVSNVLKAGLSKGSATKQGYLNHLQCCCRE